MNAIRRTPLFLCLLASTAGCGGTKPVAQPPEPAPAPERRPANDGVQMSAEVGALPPEATTAAFEQSLAQIQDCFVQGSRRVEFLSGSITFQVVVDHSGDAQDVFAERSTLGDRQTETCMFDALRAASWPQPVGGPIGVAQNSFEFEMSGDVRPAVAWDASEIADVLEEQAEALADCTMPSSARATVTMYVGTNGKPLAAGVAASNAQAEAASDCLVSVLLDAQYPEPGSWPAKVSFTL